MGARSEEVSAGPPLVLVTWRLAAVGAWWTEGRRWQHVVALLLYVAAALAFTYPLWLTPATHIAYKPDGDQLFVLSRLEWMRTSLISSPGDFFEGNFYFGSGPAMYGDHLMLGYIPIYMPLAWAFQNPVLAYTVTHVAAYILNAGAMYAAVLVLTRSRPGALVAGAVYAFGPLQVAYANHFQFLGAWWLPLVLLFGVRVWRGGGWLDFGLATLMVWMQFTTNGYLGLLAAMVYAAFVFLPAIYRVVRDRNFRLGLGMVGSGVVVTAPFIPIMYGYVTFSEAWRLERDITEVHFWSAQLRDYLSPTGRLRWYEALMERFPVPRGERRVFPGLVPPLFAVVGAGAGLLGARATGRSLRTVTALLLALGAAAVLFSLGTHWKWHETVSEIELPYLLLFENVPVFRGIRVVARFSLLAHFAAAVLAGIGVCAITRRLPRGLLSAPLAGLLAAALVLLEVAPKPLSTFAIPTDAPLRAVLQETKPGPLLFVPVSQEHEVSRLWMVTEAGAGPMVNGYSGHIWKQTWHFRDATEDLMVGELAGLAAGLQAYGVRTVVVDSAQLNGSDAASWEEFARGPWVVEVDRVDRHLLITLADPARPAAQRWVDLDVTLLMDVVDPSVGFNGALVVRNPNETPWRPPGDSRVRRVRVWWIRNDGFVALNRESDVLPPPFLRPGQVHVTPMHMLTPSEPGEYIVRAATDGEQLFERAVRVEPVDSTPFEGSADAMLARLRLRTPASFDAVPGERMPLHVDALNIGRKSWVHQAPIRLGWRWWAVDEDGAEVEQPKYEGRVELFGHLYGEIPPGRGYAFAGQLEAPNEPGRYVVRVSMLVELVAWLSIDPVEIEVVVRPSGE